MQVAGASFLIIVIVVCIFTFLGSKCAFVSVFDCSHLFMFLILHCLYLHCTGSAFSGCSL